MIDNGIRTVTMEKEERNTPITRSVTALLWDIDGTLIDTTDLVISGLDYVYRKFIGKTLPYDKIRALVGIPLVKQLQIFGDFESIGATQEEMEKEFIRFWEERKDREKVFTVVTDTLIRGFKAGIKTGLVTSKNLSEIANTLPRLGIADYLDCVICADDVRNPKPDPEGILLALKRMGVKPEDAVFIGDSVYDMRAGRDAGVRRCAVTWGAASKQDLMAEAPDLICDNQSDLRRLLNIP
jgi:pyrophosphatase PpaX